MDDSTHALNHRRLLNQLRIMKLLKNIKNTPQYKLLRHNYQTRRHLLNFEDFKICIGLNPTDKPKLPSQGDLHFDIENNIL